MLGWLSIVCVHDDLPYMLACLTVSSHTICSLYLHILLACLFAIELNLNRAVFIQFIFINRNNSIWFSKENYFYYFLWICHDELKDALVSFRIFLKSIILIENVLMFDFLFENLYIYIYTIKNHYSL